MNVPITVLEMPQGKYWQKCPYAMQGKGVAFHNTADHGNSAMAWASQRINSNAESSVHLFVDEKRAVNGSPLDRNTWHANDGGQGYANRNLWSIEVCRSTGPLETFLKAERNAAWIVALLFVEYGLEANASTIRWHYEFMATACPHRTKEQGLARIITMVQGFMAEIQAEEEDMGYLLELKDTRNNQIFAEPNENSTKLAEMKAGTVAAGLYPVIEAHVSGTTSTWDGWAHIMYAVGKSGYAVFGGEVEHGARLLEPSVLAREYGCPLQLGGGVSQADYDAAVQKAADAAADALTQKNRADAAEADWRALDKELDATIARADNAENNAADADLARHAVQAKLDRADGVLKTIGEVLG